VNLLAGGALALLRNPAQLEALRTDSDLMPNAVEELLRYDSPVQASRRITLQPILVGGTTIPAGGIRDGEPGIGEPGRPLLRP
jgi:cytochrome P450